MKWEMSFEMSFGKWYFGFIYKIRDARGGREGVFDQESHSVNYKRGRGITSGITCMRDV
jgi:hypothetical protein